MYSYTSVKAMLAPTRKAKAPVWTSERRPEWSTENPVITTRTTTKKIQVTEWKPDQQDVVTDLTGLPGNIITYSSKVFKIFIKGVYCEVPSKYHSSEISRMSSL